MQALLYDLNFQTGMHYRQATEAFDQAYLDTLNRFKAQLERRASL